MMKRLALLREPSAVAESSESRSGALPPRSTRPLLDALSVGFAVFLLLGCRRAQIPIVCPPGTRLMGAPPPRGVEVWCQKNVDSKVIKEGPFVVYTAGGGKMIEGTYRDGLQDGEWTLWYENGARASVDHYVNGLQSGRHISWYANGQKALEGEYHKGKREGVWTRWDPSGLTDHKIVYRGGKPQT
jgi:MORN repeat variant